MKYISTNEKLIEKEKIDVLSLYYYILSRNINRVLYPGNEQLAKKMGVHPTTIGRWKTRLVRDGYAVRDEQGKIILVSPRLLIRKANDNAVPWHKCTLKIDKKDDLKTIKKKLHLKLFEQLYRQASFSSRETKIMCAQKLKYGIIRSERIKKKLVVKSRMKFKTDDYVEIAVSAIAKKLGMSLRAAAYFIKELKAEGLISSRWQRAILHRDGVPIIMTPALYWRNKQELGASYMRPNGEVVQVRPNLVSLRCWSSPSPRPPGTHK